MFSVCAVVITSFLEYHKTIVKFRSWSYLLLEKYCSFFVVRNFKTQMEIRYAYLISIFPFILVLLLIKLLLLKFSIIYYLVEFLLFIATVQILTWKEMAKTSKFGDQFNNSNSFISIYATRFFVPLFWFIIFPCAIGSTSYLIIMIISAKLKEKGIDSIVYNIVVDKMLFYANIIPYYLLFIFIAIAGDFESVTHYLIENTKKLTKSYYYLDNMLHQLVLLSIKKDKFQIDNTPYLEGTEANLVANEKFFPQITAYIVAVLYRAGLFFIGILALISIASLF